MNHIVICALSNGRILGISLSTGFLLKSRDKSHQENVNLFVNFIYFHITLYSINMPIRKSIGIKEISKIIRFRVIIHQ